MIIHLLSTYAAGMHCRPGLPDRFLNAEKACMRNDRDASAKGVDASTINMLWFDKRRQTVGPAVLAMGKISGCVWHLM